MRRGNESSEIQVSVTYDNRIPELSAISVTTNPKKMTTYKDGETFDPEGMVVTATYDDGTTKAVTGYICSPTSPLTIIDNKVTKKEITITYTENEITKTTTIEIIVSPQVNLSDVILGISIKIFPNKINYEKENSFNPEGLTINVLKADKSSTVISDLNTTGLTISCEEPLTSKFPKVTVEYKGFTNTFMVAVGSDLAGIEVFKTPTQQVYLAGQSFNPAGLKIMATDKAGNTQEIDGSKVDIAGFNPYQAGIQQITVSYGGQKAYFYITVEGNKEEPSYETTGEYIINIKPETTIKEFVDNILTDCEKEVYNGENKVTNEEVIVKTGMEIKVTQDSKTSTYKLVVNGDVNGSGTVSVADITKILIHRAEDIANNPNTTKMLSNAYLKAGDLNNDGNVNLQDLAMVILNIVENK